MKAALGILIGIIVVGAIYAVFLYRNVEDPRAIKAYVESRGKSEPPSSIRSEIGKGI